MVDQFLKPMVPFSRNHEKPPGPPGPPDVRFRECRWRRSSSRTRQCPGMRQGRGWVVG
jgi:hypothetical protein